MTHPVVCPYCGNRAQLTTGAWVYPMPRHKHLWEKSFYVCWPCDAWVGCHGHGHVPLGTLANGALRKLRSRAHALFDPMWQSGFMWRSSAYIWLAKQMGIPKEQCHMAMFNEEQCQRVIDLLTHNYPTEADMAAAAQLDHVEQC